MPGEYRCTVENFTDLVLGSIYSLGKASCFYRVVEKREGGGLRRSGRCVNGEVANL